MHLASKNTTPTISERLYTPLLIVCLFLLFGLILTTHTHWGLTWDERWYTLTGLNILKRIIEFFGGTAGYVITDYEQNTYLFDVHLQTHGVLFDLLTVSVAKLVGSLHIDTLHLIRALLFGIPTFFLVSHVSKSLFGGLWAFVSMLFLLLMPSYFGHIFNNPIDIPTTFAFVLHLSYFIYFLNSNQSKRKLLILSLLIALAVTQRIVLIYLIPVDMLALLLFNRTRRIATNSTVNRVWIILGVTFFFMHITHPYLLSHPITGLKDMFMTSKSFTTFQHTILFEGTSYPPTGLPWYYLPKTIAITIPLITLICFIVGVIFGVLTVFSSKAQSKDRILLLYLLLLVSLPLALVFVMRPILYDSWRHFLFLSIPIVLLATYGLKRVFQMIARLPPYADLPLRLFLSIILLMQVLLTAREMLHLHPYQYLYHNSLVGGLQGASENYETDYWAATYREAVDKLKNRLQGAPADIFVTGNRFSATYFFGSTLTETRDFVNADYIITFTRWGAHEEMGGTTVDTVSRHDVPLTFIRTPAQEPSSSK